MGKTKAVMVTAKVTLHLHPALPSTGLCFCHYTVADYGNGK